MTTSAASTSRPPFWRDERILQILGQIAAAALVVVALWWLFGNLFENLDEQGIDRSFDSLDNPTGFSIRDDPGFDDRSPTFPDMFLVGIKNTALSAVVGIAIAVVLGVLIGIGRLSNNWLVSKMTLFYVETFRNIPPLVIITFFGFAMFTFGPLPPFNPNSPPIQVRFPGTDTNLALLSNDRWAIPSFATDGSVGPFWIGFLVAAVVAAAVWRWRTKVNLETGEPHRRWLWSLGLLAVLGTVIFVATGTPYRMSWPTIAESGRRPEGGFATNAGYLSLTLALGLYTASHVAEIIRGSILAVPKGQSEAANALALSGFQRYRFIVLPQALRIAMPPIINQFLNLTKNTSLGTVVAYPEVTALAKTAIGNGKPALQMLLVVMVIYLMFSFVWSLLLNLVNRNFQVVGR